LLFKIRFSFSIFRFLFLSVASLLCELAIRLSAATVLSYIHPYRDPTTERKQMLFCVTTLVAGYCDSTEIRRGRPNVQVKFNPELRESSEAQDGLLGPHQPVAAAA
jgi:hypothetical protein